MNQHAVDLLQTLDAAGELTTSEEDLRALTVRTSEALDDDPELWHQFYAVVAMHPSASVRMAGLECARDGRGSGTSRTGLVCWLIHDPHDLVAMRAASVAAHQALHGAVPELFAALGNSRAALERLVYARTDLRQDLIASALATLMETVDDRAAVEHSLLQAGYDRSQEASNITLDTEGMEAVPGADFLVDPAPVTMLQYEEFLRAVDELGHAWCHWGEPASYDHRPCRISPPAAAPRAGAVTGVSWFDAFAFAAWSGKRLPTSTEWRLAAEAGRASSPAESTEGVSPRVGASLDEQDEYLHQLLQGQADGISAHKTQQTAGSWEWTSSRHLDGADLSPFVGRRDHFQTIGDWTMYAVVRGGVVLSSRVRPGPSYDGRKHVLHKSPEMTFRCVADRLDR